MQIKPLLISTLILLTGVVGASESKGIYGEDNRTLLGNSPVQKFRHLAQSTASMFAVDSIEFKYNGLLALIMGESLRESEKVCKDERFSDVVTAGGCSGFLVAPDLLVTAGHCVSNEDICKHNYWVFDYRAELASTEDKVYIDSDNVYGCKELLEVSLEDLDLEEAEGADHALIRLDREVRDREPLKIRTEGKIKDSTELVVIGHPSGLPTIIADGAKVRDNGEDDYFSANLDTFFGNSGSAVINAVTGEVEGILVRGGEDYYMDTENHCRRVAKCKDDECEGEGVSRITNIEALKTKNN